MNKPNKLFFLGIIPALFIPTVFTYFYFIVFSKSFLGSVFFVLKSTFLITWPLLWIYLKYFKTDKNKNIKSSIITGFVSGILIFLSSLLLYFLLNKQFEIYKSTIINKLSDFKLNNLFLYFLFGFYMFIINSLIEEFYWRYFVFNGLKIKFSYILAGIIGSIGFTLHHIIILSQYFSISLTIILSSIVCIAGFIWCMTLQKSNNIIGPWISHIIADLIIIIIGYRLIF